MTNREFLYWLQGAFEITPNLQLTEEQVTIIVNHLFLTLAVEPYSDVTPAIEKIGDIVILSDVEEMGEKLQKVLQGVFEHVIDNSYLGNQSHLNKLHNPARKNVMRC